jgi:Zn-dependent metalloprotease
VPENGLRAYGFHADDERAATETLRSNVEALTSETDFGIAGPPQPELEKVARQYLAGAFQSAALPSLTSPHLEGQDSEFQLAGIDWSSEKSTHTVRLRQALNGIPIYGSLVTIELSESYDLVSLNSALGEPTDVNAVPDLQPSEVGEIIRQTDGYQESVPESKPRLSYYYQTDEQRWRLVYIVEDVFPQPGSSETSATRMMPLVDFVIDAHDGQVVDLLPRACAVMALDALNREREIQTSFDPITALQQLHDANLNIHTRDFSFQDVGSSFNNLPGTQVKAPPLPWNPAAVSAHANAAVVARFFQNVLARHGLDGAGGPMISSINCVWTAMGSTGRHWANSFWIKNQVVYGQRQQGSQFRSFAAALDMVGHEFFHGVIQFTARLDLKGQTGALNESYSDIFGLIIANGPNPNWNAWRWQIGADTGEPVRDVRNPSNFKHPEHMSQFQNLPLNVDFGGIHTNCGIHNKAATNIMTSMDPQGRFLFTPTIIAKIFYNSILGLGPTALFADSRRMVELQARTLLRNSPTLNLQLNAISAGFAAAGIS